MPKLKNISSNKVLKVAYKLGFILKRQSGSHIILRKEDKILVIPNHKILKIGTIKQILKILNLTEKEFFELLG